MRCAGSPSHQLCCGWVVHFVMSNQTLWTSETEWGTNIAKGLHQVNYEKCFVKINKFKIV